MAHVSDRLAAWLGDELDAAARVAVETHLAHCPDCRREADALAALWRDLASCAPRAVDASVWPAVRERTFGGRRPWFYGRRPATRLALATVALVCGALLGAWLPFGRHDAAADASFWLASSRALDDEAARPVDLWLDPGSATEVTP